MMATNRRLAFSTQVRPLPSRATPLADMDAQRSADAQLRTVVAGRPCEKLWHITEDARLRAELIGDAFLPEWIYELADGTACAKLAPLQADVPPPIDETSHDSLAALLVAYCLMRSDIVEIAS